MKRKITHIVRDEKLHRTPRVTMEMVTGAGVVSIRNNVTEKIP